MKFRLVPQEEHSFLQSRISQEVMLADFKLMPPLENHPRMEHLNLLNTKIDAIIKMLALPHNGFHSLPFKFVTISGSGMKLSSRENFLRGDVLEFKMILTMQHPVTLFVYGKVIRVERQTDGHFITVSFIMTDNAIRNHIVRFVFEMEREMLRDRRNAG
jgi:c-di-GMP-binding flagellar brake protein YcgR